MGYLGDILLMGGIILFVRKGSLAQLDKLVRSK